MKKILLFWLFLFFLPPILMAQPYADLFQIRYNNAFRSNSTLRGTPFTHIWAGSDLPIKLKEKTYLLLSPFYENWQIDSGNVKSMIPNVQCLVLPVGIIFPLKNPKWSIAINGIIRSNGEKLFAKNTLQYGAVGFVSYEKVPNQKIRLGAYMNTDFFGFFFMPLIGADWRMNSNNYFFGLLPGRFTWEHRLSNFLYTGATFRAITNSYRLQNGQYIRIDDNQLSAFLDIYPSKKICFTIEPGYGILRKLRMGTEKRTYFKNEDWGDGLFIKLSASYRIRFIN